MNSISEVNLDRAAQCYAISNTPTFLIRRLQEDPSIFGISRSFSGEQISDALGRAIQQSPHTLLDYVRPYAYLVALSMLPDAEFLRQIDVSKAKDWRWLDYAKQMLMSTYSPQSITSIQGKKASVSTSSYSSVSFGGSQTLVVAGEK